MGGWGYIFEPSAPHAEAMVFGWGRDPEPDPERAREALDRYDGALEKIEDGHREEGLDELEQVAELAGQAHTEDGYEARARALIELARADLADDAERQALERLPKAVEAGRRAGTPDGLALAARASLVQGRIDDIPGYQSPIEALEQAVRLARESQIPDGLLAGARAAYHRARWLEDEGDVDGAVDAHREAFELGQQVDSLDGDRVAAYASLEAGRLLAGRDRPAEAIETLERAAKLGGALEDAAAEVRSRARLIAGHLHVDAGDTDEARRALEEAVEIGSQPGDPRAAEIAARAAWNLADLHADESRDDEAERWYERACERALDLPDPQGPELASRIHFARGSRHQHRGEDELASKRYGDAARLGFASETDVGQNTARTARSRHVNLASGMVDQVEIPTSPQLGPPPDPPWPEGEPEQAGEGGQIPTEAEPGVGAPSDTEEAEEEEPASEPAEARPSEADGDPTGSEEVEPDRSAQTPPAAEDAPEAEPVIEADRGTLIDRAQTLHGLALERGDEEELAEAVELVDRALEQDPRDTDLLHRRAQYASTLARWREDGDALEDALETFERAFEQHGGRVDPTTHEPGPNFFFDWGRAAYELARMRAETDLYGSARETLETGYEMTPRGARHQVARALMTRCSFELARASEDEEAIEQVVDDYEDLDRSASFALEARDHELWARALAQLADLRDDPALHQQAFERMAEAYERSG